ncbi:hypothetical protein BGI33_11580 [Snodgrassella alvi]|nr:hypothetical protein BGI33_11580 [Snodgrassella alvi]PIT18807.1 hypothetical protein BGI34_04555 [Snodgrassella alvi]
MVDSLTSFFTCKCAINGVAVIVLKEDKLQLIKPIGLHEYYPDRLFYYFDVTGIRYSYKIISSQNTSLLILVIIVIFG